MTPSDQTPPLPTWIFIVTDLALISAAITIGAFQPRPFSSGAMIAIVGSLLAGAIVLFYPIVAHYERVKNEALDDRQRALEALARTLTSSAEQISIAAKGLHEVAELAQKNIRQAEHLPQKLHEKIAEFEARLAAANDAEKEELEKELVSLRTSESERLDTVSDKIFKSTAEWAKLEAATQKNLAASKEVVERAASDALATLTRSASASLAQAAAAASRSITAAAAEAELSLAQARASSAASTEQSLSRALTQAHTQAEQSLATAQARAEQSLLAAQTRAATELDEKLAALTLALTAATTAALAKIDTTLASGAERLERAVTDAAKSIPTAPVTPPPAEPAPAPVATDEIAPPTEADPLPPAEPATTITAPTEAPAHPPKRPRKPRRSDPAPEETPAPVEAVTPAAPTDEVVPPAPVSDTPANPEPAPTAEPTPPAEVALAPETTPPPAEEPPPIPVAAIAEIAPVAPHSAEPFPSLTAPEPAPAPVEASTPAPEPEPTPVVEPTAMIESIPAPVVTEPEPVVVSSPAPEPQPEPAAEIEEEKPARKRAPKKSEPEDNDPGLGLEIDDTPPPQAAEIAEHVLTSDGATRLIVTAYIGIGNRLFIRGEGPGLSWEKGVPLQFVSIGKWRWETPDATVPVNFKLYKNDTVECTALGTQTIEPAHQQDVMASF